MMILWKFILPTFQIVNKTYKMQKVKEEHYII